MAVSVISSVFEFSSADEAESAEEAVFELTGTEPIEVAGALVAFLDGDDALSSVVAVATRDSVVGAVQVDYRGSIDEHATQRLAEAAVRRLG